MATKRPLSDDQVEESTVSDETFTMVDILEEQKELEESASAVLGGSDDKNCTYLQGYVKRQALYSCKTCAASGSKGPVGVCLACCLDCHENHELVELYTKRYFRCDCGNSKCLSSFKCKHIPEKMATNEDNKYNQNFDGAYCTCKRPYPDPDDDTDDEMIQCCVCEDWFHSRHLGMKAPAEFTEMVCDACVSEHKFIAMYFKHRDIVDVESECSFDNILKKEDEGEASGDENPKLTACFFPDGWRSKLCKCKKCMAKYDESKIAFLIDENDSVESYELKGKHEKSQYEKGMEELSKMDRVQQVEVMSEYHDMKTELRNYLAEFAASGKVVTKEDISQFFDGMKNKKRRRVVIPQSCR